MFSSLSVQFRLKKNSISWIFIEFYSGIHGPQRKNPTELGDPSTFCAALQYGSHLWLKISLKHHYD